jgi:hypothetical protein
MNGEYEICKFYQNPDKQTQILRRGLSLEEARDYCDDPELSSRTAQTPKGCAGNQKRIEKWGIKQKHWFVGYRRQA